MLNKLLKKQLEEHFGNTGEQIPEGFASFITAISDVYDDYVPDAVGAGLPHAHNAWSHIAGEDLFSEEYKMIMQDGQDFSNEELQRMSLLKKEIYRRRMAELQFHNREAHLKASQRIAKVGSWEVNLENSTAVEAGHYWSDETYRIMGYEQVRKPTLQMFYNRVHPEDRSAVYKTLGNALQDKIPYFVEHRLLMPDGAVKLVCERASILYREDGEPVKMIGTIQDITGMRAYESQLEHANRELRMLVENMQEAYFSIDIENNCLIQMSAASERLYGYPVSAFEENMNLWFDVILEEDRHVIYENDVIMRQGHSIVNEYRIHHGAGSVRWLETRIEPTLDKDGRLIRIDGITWDVTRRKEMEAAVRDSEYKFRSLIQNSSDAITVIDEVFKVRFASDSAVRIIGVPPGEIIGSYSQEFTHPDDREKLNAFLQHVLDKPGERKRIVYRLLKKNGDYVWCDRVSVNLLHDPAVNGIVSNFRDITEQKKYEDALKASNEELKKSNMELDKFVYSVSHDLRAPLASMMGVVRLMELETDGSDMPEYIELLKSSIGKLDGFIGDILDYSRNARTAIEPAAIDFHEQVADITRNLRFMNTGYPVDVRVHTEGDVPFYSDKNRIVIILNNLISNAIRYHEPAHGAACIDVSLCTGAENCIIEVKDNGSGIEEKEQAKVFDMFYRASKKSVGSGLGLYIVRETVEKLNGTIALSSLPGVGTTFRIALPNFSHK